MKEYDVLGISGDHCIVKACKIVCYEDSIVMFLGFNEKVIGFVSLLNILAVKETDKSLAKAQKLINKT